MDPWYRLHGSGICPMSCADPLPKSPLYTSVKIDVWFVYIRFKKDRSVHPFWKWPCMDPFWLFQKPIFGSDFGFYYRIFHNPFSVISVFFRRTEFANRGVKRGLLFTTFFTTGFTILFWWSPLFFRPNFNFFGEISTRRLHLLLCPWLDRFTPSFFVSSGY